MTIEEIDKLKELLLDGMVEAVTMRETGFDIDTAAFANFLMENGETFADVPETNVGKWIPVSERLPKETGEYIVVIEDVEKSTSLWYSVYRNGWYDFNDDEYADPYNNVTHWMPLPEPPKESE